MNRRDQRYLTERLMLGSGGVLGGGLVGLTYAALAKRRMLPWLILSGLGAGGLGASYYLSRNLHSNNRSSKTTAPPPPLSPSTSSAANAAAEKKSSKWKQLAAGLGTLGTLSAAAYLTLNHLAKKRLAHERATKRKELEMERTEKSTTPFLSNFVPHLERIAQEQEAFYSKNQQFLKPRLGWTRQELIKKRLLDWLNSRAIHWGAERAFFVPENIIKPKKNLVGRPVVIEHPAPKLIGAERRYPFIKKQNIPPEALQRFKQTQERARATLLSLLKQKDPKNAQKLKDEFSLAVQELYARGVAYPALYRDAMGTIGGLFSTFRRHFLLNPNYKPDTKPGDFWRRLFLETLD